MGKNSLQSYICMLFMLTVQDCSLNAWEWDRVDFEQNWKRWYMCRLSCTCMYYDRTVSFGIELCQRNLRRFASIGLNTSTRSTGGTERCIPFQDLWQTSQNIRFIYRATVNHMLLISVKICRKILKSNSLCEYFT